VNRDIAATLMLAALAQLAAFGKSVLVAYYFGIGTDVDGYYLAQVIPVTLAGIVTGFLQTGFLTVYTEYLVKDRNVDAAALLGRTLQIVAAAGLALSLIIAVAAPWLLQLLAPGAAPAARDAATYSLRALAFLLVLNVLVDCLGLALNAHRSFALAALAPTANALVASALLLAAPDWGLANLVSGTLLGVLVQLLLVAYAMRLRRIRIAWSVASEWREIFRVGSSIVPGLIFANASAAVPTIVAASLGEGAVAAFSVALRLHGAATQAFTIAVSTVLLPHFALAVGRADSNFIRNWLANAFLPATLIALATTLWVGLEGQTFVSLVYQRGAFDATATGTVAGAWFLLTLGLLPSVWGVSMAKVLQAFRLGGTMSGIAFAALILTIGLSVLLSSRAGLMGLALTPGIAALGATVMCIVVANRKLGGSQTDNGSFVKNRVARLLAISALLTAIAFSASSLIGHQSAPVRAVILAFVLFAAVLAMAAVVHLRHGRSEACAHR
jgi:putative peptidoglycan lipid II flippase